MDHLRLSAALREATHDAHRRAERAGLMSALLAGRLPVERYGELLRNLRAIYAALEDALRSPAARAAGVDLTSIDGLARLAALDGDLARLDARLRPPEPLAAATHDYVRALARLVDTEPHRLAAHAYVRYLGDLNGGQILGRIVARAYGDAGATRFHDFGDADAVARLSAAVRDRLDAIEGNRQAIVDEAVAAFERHVALFSELASSADASRK